VAVVPSAVPAFIGFTEFAVQKLEDDLVLKPYRITSMAEYVQHFGDAPKEDKITVKVTETKVDGKTESLAFEAKADESKLSKNIMAYALRLYFANGGGPCYIVSTGKYAAPSDTELLKALLPLEKADEPTLLVFPEAQSLPSASQFANVHDQALKHCAKLKNRFVIMDVYGQELSNPSTRLLDVVTTFRDTAIGANNLKYGAAYAPNLDTVIDYVVDEDKTEITHEVVGGATTTPKLSGLKLTENQIYEGARAAIRDLPCKLPPSAAIAGIYAAVDNERGVWKAPANVGVAAVIGPTIAVSADDHEQMNVDSKAGKSVNAVKVVSGKGTMVYGARTLAGNDNEWRYVNVRRLFIVVEESLKRATEAFVFEPNDAHTWTRVKGMCDSFLSTLWRQGALQGAREEHAFKVSVGLGSTMTPDDILNGRLIIELALAAVRPAEFIVLRFSHKMAES
jgi:phage tail sheath protein FI